MVSFVVSRKGAYPMKRIVMIIGVMMLLLCACGNSSDTDYVDTQSTSLREIYDMYPADEKEEFLRDLLADEYEVSEDIFLFFRDGELRTEEVDTIAREVLEAVSYELDEINRKQSAEDGLMLISDFIEGTGSKEDLIEGFQYVSNYWDWVSGYSYHLSREGTKAVYWPEDAS